MAGRLRFSTIRQRIVDKINETTDEHGVTAYVTPPNRWKFPAFFAEPGTPPIDYNFDRQAFDRSINAVYHLSGYVMVAHRHPAVETQDELDDLLAPDGPFMEALNDPSILGDLEGELVVNQAADYGDIEYGSKPDNAFASRLVIDVEV